ncbi:hypothetical protein OHA18_17005 [Kribbella sp. NBC_00709]|uniref:hypothetical protein n=1 Tax=Kribbella sp. NBC_00709 TaxID=2975972 RepID=UPI002E2BA184|nr:hypothetical protein [Kribbella sp. NBC_00709]
MKRRITALAGGAALAAAALVPTNAQAAGDSATAVCNVPLGSVTATGGQRNFTVTANLPPTIEQGKTLAVYQPGQVRLSARQTSEPGPGGDDRYGYVVIGDALYSSGYRTTMTGDLDPENPPGLGRIGGGWTNFTAIELADYASQPLGNIHHTVLYGLRNDGVLFRWNQVSRGLRANGSYPGFASVKSMALIAKTPTYDTFLANTRGGALYTIRIPLTSPMKPIVTPVRTRTWQGFETLSAMACGKNGTLLLGIDKDSKTANLYAVGHANGTATVIQSRGLVPGTFDDPAYFRWVPISIFDIANGD